MTLLDFLAENHMTISELSRKSGVPKSTLSDITTGKYYLEDCRGSLLKDIAKAMNVSVDYLLQLENELAKSTFPPFLNLSIKNYRKAKTKNSSLLSEYIMDLNSSINIAETENLISKKIANQLRRRYFTND